MYNHAVFAKLVACVKIGQGPGLVANARKWNVMTLPVLAILYPSTTKYKNVWGSLDTLRREKLNLKKQKLCDKI